VDLVLTDGKHWTDKPPLSPDGKTIYFYPGRSWLYDIWGISLDPTVARLLGFPFC